MELEKILYSSIEKTKSKLKKNGIPERYTVKGIKKISVKRKIRKNFGLIWKKYASEVTDISPIISLNMYLIKESTCKECGSKKLANYGVEYFVLNEDDPIISRNHERSYTSSHKKDNVLAYCFGCGSFKSLIDEEKKN